MFGKKENEVKPITRIMSNSPNVTFMAEDCEIKGSFLAKGNARIDGRVEGTISVAGDLAIGSTAVLKANIDAQTICLAGEVRGNVRANELLELSSTARLYGDINTKELKIDQGAHFVGTSTYDESINANSNLYSGSFSNETGNTED